MELAHAYSDKYKFALTTESGSVKGLRCVPLLHVQLLILSRLVSLMTFTHLVSLSTLSRLVSVLTLPHLVSLMTLSRLSSLK